MRQAASVDKNQAEIVGALRKCGISVHSTAALGKGFPDLVCARGSRTWLIEVKGQKGKLTPEQEAFLINWAGEVHIARSVDDALQIVGVL